MRMLIFLLILGMNLKVQSQVINQARVDSILNAQILSGDSIPHIDLPEVAVMSKPVFKSRRDARRYWRLVHNLKKVMPYSEIIADMVIQIDQELTETETSRERRKLVRMVEDSLWNQYEVELRKMTVSQGRLLFKLVDRETSATTYTWIELYRGSVPAFFWQGVARIFSSNLKVDYDPEGEDKLIEQLIGYIKKGYI